MEFNKFIYNEDFIFEDNRIKMTSVGLSKIKKAKKITGSRLASVLGLNEYSTPFQVWCDILGFYKLHPEVFFTGAGIVIEPLIREWATKKLNQKFLVYDPFKIHFDAFHENRIFGGMPDGEPIDDENKFLYPIAPMLEIKTASIDEYTWTTKNNELMLLRDVNGLPIVKKRKTKISKWIVNQRVQIPISYQYQLGLYLYLRKTQNGIFCIALLDYEDYLNPQNFDPNKNTLIIEKMKIDIQLFQETIDYATKWYNNHISNGISPELSSSDLEWFRFGYKEI